MRIFMTILGLLSVLITPTANADSTLSKPLTLKDMMWGNPASEEVQNRTVWSLQKMAEDGRLDELNELFNNGLRLQKLPEGYAAGAGARVFKEQISNPKIDAIFDDLTGKNWRGKIFFRSDDPKHSQGLNRIKLFASVPQAPIVRMAHFTTDLLDSSPLVPDVHSNFVILNYSKPYTTGYYWQEWVLANQIQVYDVMVAVPGKYGPVFIGKTWIGKYDDQGNFTPKDNKLIAWFFLDFNAEALKVQKAEHWDGTSEEIFNPVPKADLQE